ncbi:MAG: ATP-binding protein [Coriobacteriales bacterium]|jgi:predicted AAA+ superfamily ATPase|nr:ATP-binding protein [Coriobacteriales bacterium]
MDYLKRDLERKFLNTNTFFKAILVTGARQVGKTTMLKHLANKQDRTYVTLDDIAARDLAKRDPALFFQMYKPPIIIDEVQYAPELFARIKLLCDESDIPGLFWLTGSQHFQMMKNIQESLAGRIGILELYSLSKREIDGINYDEELAFSLDELKKREQYAKQTDIIDIFEYIWKGGMPQTISANTEQRQDYWNAYVSTYLMRDASELGGITDTLRFGKFLTACAALIGRQLNYKTLADASDIAQSTAKEWTRLLQGMGIIYLLQPFANNALKRLSKTPKLYFFDTGLAASLSMWPNAETLINGPACGYYFENFVVTQLVRNYAYSPTKAALSYYRDQNIKEIDILVEKGKYFHPLEIKMSASPDYREVKKFAVLDKVALERGAGGIICMTQNVMPIDSNNCFIPCNLL